MSIVEAVPDPRNHLAMVRDLSGEVRVTDVEQTLLQHAYDNREPDHAELPAPPAPAPPPPPPPAPPAFSPHPLPVASLPKRQVVQLVPLDPGPHAQPDDGADEAVVDVREGVEALAQPTAKDPYYDLGEIAENTPLTGRLFTSSD